MKRSGKVLACVLALSLGGARVARASDEDDKKKTEKKLEKAEKDQNKKEEPKADDDGLGGENPLPKIVELMKKVEERLAETDTGSYTQEEQKKIVEAMNLGGKAKSALDDLIKKIEESGGA